MDRSIAGPGLVSAGLRGMLNVASGPLKKGVKAVTSTISAIDDLTKKREENRANWLERDPEIKCYLPCVPRANYMAFPFQIFHLQTFLV